ncbi:type II secretion system F family protein [bacterium]|nr:type II secretion system F family protein [bacterium]
MPVFQYKALTAKGDATDGVIDADTPKEARDKLRSRSVYVTEMQALDARTKQETLDKGSLELDAGSALTALKSFKLPNLRARAARGEVVALTRLLATLLHAGIPLVDALNSLITQIENKYCETVLRQVKEDVQRGASFADALSRHSDLFDNLYVNMVRAGEAAGALDEVLKRLASFLQAQSRMRNRVAAALTYPVIMTVCGSGVVTFLMMFVVPRITRIFEKKKTALPAPTQMLLAIQHGLTDYWWVGAIAIAAIVLVYRMYTRTESGALWKDTTKLKLPVFGELFRKQSIARFATTFSTLLKSGVQATDALRILGTVVDNRLLAQVLEDVRLRIIEGADISTPIKKSRVFPPVVGDMIAIGEESGQLEDLLDRIAEAYDEEIEVTTQRVTATIEPAIIICMAVVVGFIVMSIILPLVQIGKLGG